MSRAHLFRPLQDAAGNLQRGATVRLYRPGTTTLVSDTIYTSEDGVDEYSQPISCPNGYLSVYLANPRRVRVGVTPFGGGTEVFFDDIDAQRTFQRAQEVPLDPVGGMISQDVQAAIEELQNSKASVDVAGRQTASETPYDPPAGSSLSSTDVQGALSELEAEKYGPTNHQIAADTPFTPAGTIAATNTQAAVEEVATDAAAALASHVSDADPHPQYLTPAEGAAAYDASGAAASAVGAHEAASDPHPQYLTQAEGDARYIGTGVTTGTTVDEEGVALTLRPVINFVGRRVTAIDDAANNRTNIVVAQPFALKTANYTLTPNDDVVFFNGANLVATLPTPVGNAGLQFTVKNTNATVLTVTPAAGTIDGDPSRNLAQYDALILVSDGTNWGVI